MDAPRSGTGAGLQLRVGAFVLVSLLVFAGLVYMLGRSAGLFERQYRLTASFGQIGGLIKGATVRLAGVPVGHVGDIRLPEAGGALIGMSRTVKGGATESFEFMRLVPAGEEAGFHVQPNGVAPTLFVIAERGEQRVLFENAAHDFPNRIEYRREGDALHAWIAGPGDDGKTLKIPFEYRRCGG